jgi:glycosyltransferase involved in cell wall biosynthesis
MKKKVAIIGIVGVPACYGGFETLVENLLSNSNGKIDYTVFCSLKSYSGKKILYKGATLKYINLYANGLQSIIYDGIALFRSFSFDAVIVLGCSGAIFIPFFRKFFNGMIILNIDGAEWRRNKWSFGVRLLLRFFEFLAIQYADIIIGDNQVIVDSIYSKYGKNAKLIEYGGDNSFELIQNPQFDNILPKYYAITICRIVPENNIKMILETFSHINSIPYVIVGNWDSTSYGRSLKDNFDSVDSIYMLDPIYDNNQLNSLRSKASLYIHGHSAGGTNPSLVEAMSFGLPVFAYKCDYNYETTEGKCMYFKNSFELLELLRGTNEEELRKIGTAMAEIAKRRYTWKLISKLYEEILI